MFILYDLDNSQIAASGDLQDVIRAAMRRNVFGDIADNIGELETLRERINRLEEFIALVLAGGSLNDLNGRLQQYRLVIYEDRP